MSATMEIMVNARVLSRLVDWGKGIRDFKRSHAIDGLFITQRYLDEQAAAHEDKLFSLALVLTFWFWLDDRSDDHLAASAVDWPSLLLVLSSQRDEVPWAVPMSIEAEVLLQVSAQLQKEASTNVDHEWWFTSAKYTIRNLLVEERATQTRAVLALADYLEIGLWTSAVPNLMATVSLLYGLDIARRRVERDVAALERYVSIVARLENDLFGVEKERREGTVANAVLLMERYLTKEPAREFIQAEKQAYERRLQESLSALGIRDPLARLVRAMLASHRSYYAARPLRTDRSPVASDEQGP